VREEKKGGARGAERSGARGAERSGAKGVEKSSAVEVGTAAEQHIEAKCNQARLQMLLPTKRNRLKMQLSKWKLLWQLGVVPAL
jgi:hypothetical protein